MFFFKVKLFLKICDRLSAVDGHAAPPPLSSPEEQVQEKIGELIFEKRFKQNLQNRIETHYFRQISSKFQFFFYQNLFVLGTHHGF